MGHVTFIKQQKRDQDKVYYMSEKQTQKWLNLYYLRHETNVLNFTAPSLRINFIHIVIIHSFIQLFGMCSGAGACPSVLNFFFLASILDSSSSMIHPSKDELRTQNRLKSGNTQTAECSKLQLTTLDNSQYNNNVNRSYYRSVDCETLSL